MSRPVVMVEEDPEEPVERQVLATAIRDISKAMTRLLASGLNREAIIILTHATTPGVTKSDVRAVFKALVDLEKRYCT